jgi:hypothetical protein
MIETEDRQGRAGFGDKSGIQGKNCRQGGPGRTQQGARTGSKGTWTWQGGKVSEDKKGGRVSRLTKLAKGWVGRPAELAYSQG